MSHGLVLSAPNVASGRFVTLITDESNQQFFLETDFNSPSTCLKGHLAVLLHTLVTRLATASSLCLEGQQDTVPALLNNRLILVYFMSEMPKI